MLYAQLVYPTEILLLNFKKNGDKNKPPLTLHIFVFIFYKSRDRKIERNERKPSENLTDFLKDAVGMSPSARSRRSAPGPIQPYRVQSSIFNRLRSCHRVQPKQKRRFQGKDFGDVYVMRSNRNGVFFLHDLATWLPDLATNYFFCFLFVKNH